MHALHVFARINATSTFACLEYVQTNSVIDVSIEAGILQSGKGTIHASVGLREYVQIRAIRANTDKDTCIYIHQIGTNTSACICILKIRILQVYDRICMFMTVYASISLHTRTVQANVGPSLKFQVATMLRSLVYKSC
jgi:hypothetical protein